LYFLFIYIFLNHWLFYYYYYLFLIVVVVIVVLALFLMSKPEIYVQVILQKEVIFVTFSNLFKSKHYSSQSNNFKEIITYLLVIQL